MVFSFLNYLPFSKHFHIILAFPNTFYSNLKPKGQLTNMESVMKEVKMMMDPDADPYAAPAEPEGEIQRFGAKDVEDLTWRSEERRVGKERGSLSLEHREKKKYGPGIG